MSDLFKKNAPRLSDDEDRRLWQRVRAVPEEVAAEREANPAAGRVRPGGASGGRPWWRGFLLSPAFRFGAPALAVLVAAVLFVIQQQPHPPVPPHGGSSAPARTEERAPRDAESRAPANELRAVPETESEQVPSAEIPAPTDERAKNLAKLAAPAAPAPQATLLDEARRQTVEAGDEGAKGLDRKEATASPRARSAAPSPPPARPFATAPEPVRERVTVIKGGKQTSDAPAPSAEGGATAPSPAAKPESAGSASTWGSVKSQFRKDDIAAQKATPLAAAGSASAESVVSRPAGDELHARGGRASEQELRVVDGLSGFVALAPGGATVWSALIAAPSSGSWIEIIRSEFDPGSVVVLAGSRDARARLELAGRTFVLERSPASAPGAVMTWLERQSGEEPRATLEIPAVGESAPQVLARSGKPRRSFRDAPEPMQVAYLAAEAERATVISAAPAARARFDRILSEARALAVRRPTDARVQRLIELVTAARANLR